MTSMSGRHSCMIKSSASSMKAPVPKLELPEGMDLALFITIFLNTPRDASILADRNYSSMLIQLTYFWVKGGLKKPKSTQLSRKSGVSVVRIAPL